jgi:hypothetical protein
MANVDIKFTTENGSVFVDTPSLTVVDGEMFTVTSHGGAASLVFSSDLAAAVSPQPGSPLTLADGESTTFTFTSSDPSGYFIGYGPAGLPINAEFPSERSNILYLQTSAVAIPSLSRPVVVLDAVAAAVAPTKGGSGPVLNPRGAD